MRILVTGADGFVGKNATRVFRQRGHDVIELVGGGPETGKQHVDIRNKEAVRAALDGTNVSHVLHLAGASSVARSHENPTEAFEVNTVGTVNVLDAVRRTSASARVLVVSSGEVYGRLDHPAREEDAARPTSPYAASKLAAELAASQFRASYGLAAVVARPFNHLGPGQASHFAVPSFARQIQAIVHAGGKGEISVGNLDAVRDVSHVLDVIDAYEILLERGVPGEIYNISSGEGRSVRGLLDELIELAGVEVTPQIDPERVRPTEIPSLVGDSSRLRALGWAPHRLIRDALRAVLSEAQDG